MGFVSFTVDSYYLEKDKFKEDQNRRAIPPSYAYVWDKKLENRILEIKFPALLMGIRYFSSSRQRISLSTWYSIKYIDFKGLEILSYNYLDNKNYMASPNGNYYRGTIEFAPNLVWEGIVPVIEKLRDYYNYPVLTLTNDANAAAIGEMIYGGAKGMNDFIFITLGTGLGSGIVVNGELVYGHDGFAGEIGHVLVEPNGRLCGCGRKGCLETYASATGLRSTVLEMLKNFMKPQDHLDFDDQVGLLHDEPLS